MMNKTYPHGMTLATRALAAIALALLCAMGSRAVAQDSSPEKKQNIRRLLELTRATEVGTMIIDQTMAQLRLNLGNLPPEVRGQISAEKMQRILSVFEEELRKEFAPEKMAETIIPIYDKHLTDEDVKGLIVFYESPLGRKVIGALPQILRESYQAGASLGEQVVLRATGKLEAEGTLPSAGGPPPEPKPRPQSNTGTRRGRRRN